MAKILPLKKTLSASEAALHTKNTPYFFLLPLSLFSFLYALQIFVGNHYYLLNPDEIYYTLAAQRFAEGKLIESLSPGWLPLVSWISSLWITLGVPAFYSVLFTNYLAAISSLALLYFFSKRLIGSWAALLACLAFLLDPLFYYESVAARADVLYLCLSFGSFVLLGKTIYKTVWEASPLSEIKARWLWGIAALGVLLTLTRIAAFPLVALISLLLLFCPNLPSRTRKRAFLIYVAGVSFVILLLCAFTYHKIKLFLPSGNFYANKLYVANAEIKGVENFLYELYDGKNTIVGDYNFYESGTSLPNVPHIPARVLWKYRLNCIVEYFKAIGGLGSPLVLFLASVGLFALIQRGNGSAVLLCLIWGAFTTGACLLANVQPRFFLPLLPIVYFLYGWGIYSLYPLLQRPIRIAFNCAVLGLSVLLLLPRTNLALLKTTNLFRMEKSAGSYLLETKGPGRRILTLENYQSAVDSLAFWRPVPYASAESLRNYLSDKKIEFAILPKRPFTENEKGIAELVAMGTLRPTWENKSEVLYQIY